MKVGITLGPVLAYWPARRLYDFYEAMLDLPLAAAYVGETVCAKRRALGAGDWIELARAVQRRGIQAVLSTLTLIEARSELAGIKRLCDNDGLLVEANDYAAVRYLHERRVPWVGGATLNLYNAPALEWLTRRGMVRWQPPVDMDLGSLAALHDEAGQWPETEILALGRVPLAWSARCFTARAEGRQKDQCDFVCGEHPDGMLVDTRDGQPFLVLNGVQTLSAAERDLGPEIAQAVAAGASLLRVNPAGAGTYPAVLELAGRLH